MTTNNMQLQRLLATACACGLVIASAGFGAVYAYRVGSEHSAFLAALSVLMALGLEGCKPLAISLAMKCKSARVVLPMACLGLVAVTYSLTAELSLMASNKSDLAATRTAQSEAAREAVGRRQRITDELLSLGLQRPSESIQAELNALLTDKRLNNCQGWLANVRLREICIDQVSPLQAEFAKAERREKLEAELNGITKEGDAVQVGSSDPGSIALATYLGALGITVRIDVVSQWLVLVPVLALELGSAFAVVLVHSLPNQTAVQVKLPARSREPKQDREAWTRDSACRQVLLALQAGGGCIVGNERDFAVRVGHSKPTVRRAILQLEAQGVLKRVSSRAGTRLEAVNTYTEDQIAF